MALQACNQAKKTGSDNVPMETGHNCKHNSNSVASSHLDDKKKEEITKPDLPITLYYENNFI